MYISASSSLYFLVRVLVYGTLVAQLVLLHKTSPQTDPLRDTHTAMQSPKQTLESFCLFQAGVPNYEDFVNKAAKLHSHLK